MIAVDSSAAVAIAFDEPDRESYETTIPCATKALISTVSVVEVKMVIYRRRDPRAVSFVDHTLRWPVFEITSPTLADMDGARS